MAKAKKVDLKTETRRQWCVEMAVRWPTYQSGSYGGGAAAAYGSVGAPLQTHDADVIARAKKIESYLTDSK